MFPARQFMSMNWMRMAGASSMITGLGSSPRSPIRMSLKTFSSLLTVHQRFSHHKIPSVLLQPPRQVAHVSTHQRQFWRRKKDKFLRKMKLRMRRTKLPQIEVREAVLANRKQHVCKKRAVPIQHRMRLSHMLFRRER